MKIALFALVFLSSTAFGQLPDRAKTLSQLRGLIKEQGDEILRVENDLKASKEYAATLWTDLEKAQSQLNEVGKERDGWRSYGEDQHEKFINAEKRVAEEKVKKQRWFMLFSGLAVLVIAYFGLKFFTPLRAFL